MSAQCRAWINQIYFAASTADCVFLSIKINLILNANNLYWRLCTESVFSKKREWDERTGERVEMNKNEKYESIDEIFSIDFFHKLSW